MSADAPTSFADWWRNLRIPWLVGGVVGTAEATANGTVFDQQVSLIKQATKARMPDYAPVDALAHIGGDRQLEQGPSEGNATFVTRLLTAWDDWTRAGTALELLVQLYWDGFPNAVIAQQNGLIYSLSGAPVAGSDPSGLLVTTVANYNPSITQRPYQTILVTATGTGALGAVAFTFSVNGIATATSILIVSGSNGAWYQVPGSTTWVHFVTGSYNSGSTYTVNPDGTTASTGGGGVASMTFNASPWWTIDNRDYFTSRFAVLFPTTIPAAWRIVGYAVFDGTQDTVDVIWPIAFDDAKYFVSFTQTVTSASTPVIYLPPANITATGVRVATSERFIGQVDLIAWQAGANPYANPRGSELSRLRRIIARWKPAKATCSGIHIVVEGQMIGYPVRTIGSGTVGTSTIAIIPAT